MSAHSVHQHSRALALVSLVILLLRSQTLADEPSVAPENSSELAIQWHWQSLPDLPNPLGVAGPFVGVHQDHLIVAGGANFPTPVWKHEKQWLDQIFVLNLTADKPQWRASGTLPTSIAYGASISTSNGLLCLGGNNATQVFDDVYRLRWDASRQSIVVQSFGKLPVPLAYCQVTMLGDQLLLVGGQQGSSLETATQQAWVCDLPSAVLTGRCSWRAVATCPGPPRALHLLATQSTAAGPVAILISGRSSTGGEPQFLTDTWLYDPRQDQWHARQAAPRCLMAGAAAAISDTQIAVLGGDDGVLFSQTDTLRDSHPGFPREAFIYDSQLDRWLPAESLPTVQLTTPAVRWRNHILLVSGEVRPRVRTPASWQIDWSF